VLCSSWICLWPTEQYGKVRQKEVMAPLEIVYNDGLIYSYWQTSSIHSLFSTHMFFVYYAARHRQAWKLNISFFPDRHYLCVQRTPISRVCSYTSSSSFSLCLSVCLLCLTKFTFIYFCSKDFDIGFGLHRETVTTDRFCQTVANFEIAPIQL
jgi:hypothetical protein